MVDAPDIDERGGPDRPCGRCGHAEVDHVLRDIEEPGRTVRQAYCESCDASCDFVPSPEDLRRRP
jgi:hypothetical protein